MEAETGPGPSSKQMRYTVINTACVNNGPFEYVPDDPRIVALIAKVEAAMESDETTCADVMDQDKVDALWYNLSIKGHELGTAKAYWDSITDSPVMRVINGADFRSKRFASMPDRKTNNDRPAITTAADAGDFQTWWATKYLPFWFGGDAAAIGRLGELKYDTLTPAEREASVPFQILGISLFDCALMHFANQASPDGELLRIKASLATDRAANIVKSIVRIVAPEPNQILFLHEVSVEVRKRLAKALPEHRLIHNVDGDQMSIIVVPNSWGVVTANAAPGLREMVEFDDQAVAAALLKTDRGKLVLAVSVHADTDGTISIPVVEAAARMRDDAFPGAKLVVGIDANTAAGAKGGKLSLRAFMSAVRANKLITCHGDNPDPAVHYTSKKRRSVLQTQLHKAVSVRDPKAGFEQEVKLFLLTDNVEGTRIDNTRLYSDLGASCPNPECPGDHFPQTGVIEFA